MDPMTLLDTVQDRAASVVAQISAEQMGAPSACAGWDVRTCLNKLVTSTRYWVVALNEGREDPTLDLGNPPDLIGADALGAYRAAAAACRSAFERPGVFTAMVPCSVPGVQLSGEQMLGVRIFDTTVITWDLATAVGVAHGISDEQADFARAVSEVVLPAVSGASDRQRFQPCTVGLDANASAVDRLIAATGRNPQWAPA